MQRASKNVASQIKMTIQITGDVSARAKRSPSDRLTGGCLTSTLLRRALHNLMPTSQFVHLSGRRSQQSGRWRQRSAFPLTKRSFGKGMMTEGPRQCWRSQWSCQLYEAVLSPSVQQWTHRKPRRNRRVDKVLAIRRSVRRRFNSRISATFLSPPQKNPAVVGRGQVIGLCPLHPTTGADSLSSASRLVYGRSLYGTRHTFAKGKPPLRVCVNVGTGENVVAAI
jgi:hypothetical protein